MSECLSTIIKSCFPDHRVSRIRWTETASYIGGAGFSSNLSLPMPAGITQVTEIEFAISVSKEQTRINEFPDIEPIYRHIYEHRLDLDARGNTIEHYLLRVTDVTEFIREIDEYLYRQWLKQFDKDLEEEFTS